MEKIKFVYFDVGGVLLLDFTSTHRWIQMRRDLGVAPEKDEVFDSVWKKHRPKICIDCDVDTISGELARVCGIELPNNYSMLSDFIDRFDTNPSIWGVVEKAKNFYSVGLLTNMYPRMLDNIKQRQLLPMIHWDVEVDSSVVGFQKPDPGIFDVAEKLSHSNPEQIFFIDNSEEHVLAAKRRGWNAMLYNPNDPEESSKRVAEFLDINS